MRGFILASLLLVGCASALPPAEVPSGTVSPFSDDAAALVLVQHRDTTQRLARIAARITAANAALCPATRRDIGVAWQSASDYPADLLPMAQDLFEIGSDISIRFIAEGSPAERAGLTVGDRLRGWNDVAIPTEEGQSVFNSFYEGGLAPERMTVDVERDGMPLSVEVSPRDICAYPVRVLFSPHLNGHTDGTTLWITSGLVEATRDLEPHLALVIAHEMAHAVAGHLTQLDMADLQDLERDADRMGLVMAARAGYDVDDILAAWEAAHRRFVDGPSLTHPALADRLETLQREAARIRGVQAAGEPLLFSSTPQSGS